MSGPKVRTDIAHVYVFARTPSGLRFFQARRVGGSLDGAWQPVMGRIEPGETAIEGAVRELREETGLDARAALGVWTLGSVDAFLIARTDEIYLSPQLAVEVEPGWTPALNDEHDEWRWVERSEVAQKFMWPGQHRAIQEIERFIAQPSLAREHLRVTFGPERS